MNFFRLIFNARTFQVPYFAVVDENTPTGTSILNNISVIDRDTVGENLEVTCLNTADSPNACDVFDVKEMSLSVNDFKGSIVLAMALNYSEQEDFKFSLKATVSLF